MGGKSSSSNESTVKTTTTTNQLDNRIGLSGGGLIATDGAIINNENVTEGVIEAALKEVFTFSKDAIATIGDVKAQELSENSNFGTFLKAGTAIAAVYFVTKVWK